MADRSRHERISAALLVMTAAVAASGAPLARASDHGGEEGLFNNRGKTSLYCYKDIYPEGQWRICHYKVPPGSSCRGDGIAARVGGPVFKIPNRSEFNCSHEPVGSFNVQCKADGRISDLLINLASIHHGGKGYGNMSWDSFYGFMTGGSNPPQGECDKDWIPILEAPQPPPEAICK